MRGPAPTASARAAPLLRGPARPPATLALDWAKTPRPSEQEIPFLFLFPFCRRFETGGVPGPTSEMSPRAPAQMGRREAEREGGRKVAGDGRERGGNPAAFVFVPRLGRVRLQ
jgi:hypothetical protein